MKDFREENLVKVIRVRKAESTFAKWGFLGPILLETTLAGIMAFGGMSLEEFFSITTVPCCLLNFFVQTNDNRGERKSRFLRGLTDDISKKIGNNYWHLSNLSDITIIPKNIKVGENLEAVNIIPIFKEGHFIIVEGLYSPVVLAQYKDDDGNYCVKLLEEDEAIQEMANLDEKEKRMLKRRRKKILSFLIDK